MNAIWPGRQRIDEATAALTAALRELPKIEARLLRRSTHDRDDGSPTFKLVDAMRSDAIVNLTASARVWQAGHRQRRMREKHHRELAADIAAALRFAMRTGAQITKSRYADHQHAEFIDVPRRRDRDLLHAAIDAVRAVALAWEERQAALIAARDHDGEQSSLLAA